jgi:putative CocE/NonD family hydrolase
MSSDQYEGSKVGYQVFEQKNVMVAMRDGIELATDIYYPAIDKNPMPEAFPVILERTPYHNGNPTLTTTAHFFAKRGYVVVLQDVRGRGESEGEWAGLVLATNETNDGYDTMAWINEQPWSSGKVGTIGASYTGATQGALALTNPPGLKAQFIMDSGYNYHTHTFRSGGAFSFGIIFPYTLSMASAGKDAQQNPTLQKALLQAAENAADMLEHLKITPLKRDTTALSMAPAYENMLFELAMTGDYNQLWKDPSFNAQEHIDRYPDVPIFQTTGWYAHHVWASTTRFNDLTLRNSSPQRLVIGPWLHTVLGLGDTFAAEVEFGLDSVMANVNDLRLKWFDHHLKGMHTDVLDGPPIHVFIMGGGSGKKDPSGRLVHGGYWRSEYKWPLEGTTFTNYYLKTGGELSPEAPMDPGPPSKYIFDPRDPVPTIGGGIQGAPRSPGFIIIGPFDQRGRRELKISKDTLPLSMRADVLVFQTSPLEEDLEVVGPIEVKLWASSSAFDTDFTAKLIDVYPSSTSYPDGFALNLCDGIIRARYRNDRERQELMEPGKPYKFRIDLQATGNLFKKGHRVRLDISSSNFPHYDVNPNTGGPLWGSNQGWQSADQQIYHDSDHASYVVLPILPRK